MMEFSGSATRFKTILVSSNQKPANGVELNRGFMAPVSFPPKSNQHGHESNSPPFSSSSSSSDGVSSPEGNEVSKEILRYISDMLMNEEDLEWRPCMLQECLAFQAAEKSFHDVLKNESPSPPILPLHHLPDYNSANQPVHSTIPRDRIPRNQFQIAVSEFQKLSEDRNFHSPPDSNGKRNHRGITEEQEGRSQKLSAISNEDSELAEIFEKVLLCQRQNQEAKSTTGEDKKLKNRLKSVPKSRKKKELVDLWSLLTQCAHAMANYDQRTAKESLFQIRLHSSVIGDGTQRLAYYFANGLEARLAAGTPSYKHLPGNENSAAEILKAYQVYVGACPYKRVSNILANKSIAKLAENSSNLHIIDFGIFYGFQWPCLIQLLSRRSGGSPKLRITGIELPQPGFRPTERVEETGRRLRNYCRKLNVPFEFNFIAQKWETIRVEDLRLDGDELLVVNCVDRLKNIPDETMGEDSPRDTVLTLIRSINPKLFVHGVVNGTYNAPFFDSRFKEATFHFSSQFDMLEATIERENPHRLVFEREILGRDAINAIACEGLQRMERPESYKQWQVRNTRAGFKQTPLERDIVKNVESIVKSDYHKNFVVVEDGNWMLQGWKGRIIHAFSCWVPS